MKQAPDRNPVPQPGYHLAGIGGVGMSALAELLRGKGFDVQGSDRHADQGVRTPALERLKRQGIRILPQDGHAIHAGLAALVYSTAIEDDNPDLMAARRAGIPILHRAELLAEWAAGHRVIAVGGTAGKTTVTGMTGWLLEQAGLDPTVVSGGGVLNWQGPDRGGSVRVGASDLWVIEADESDRSLLRFQPAWATITNLSQDHFALDETVELFRQFRARCREGLVYGPGTLETLGPGPAGLLGLSLEGAAIQPEQHCFMWQGETYSVTMPGRHNLLNALTAVALARALGVEPDCIRTALGQFAGIERRLQETGVVRGIRVWDDYAHNPAKLAAAWQTAATGSSRVFGIWRPHGYGPLRANLQELTDAFAGCMRREDRLFLLPVYDAGGTADRSVRSKDLASLLAERGFRTDCVADYETLKDRLVDDSRGGDVILVMGARDPGLQHFAGDLPGYLAAEGG